MLAAVRFATDAAGYRDMLVEARRFLQPVQGCNGIGEHIAHRLRHDGEALSVVCAKVGAWRPSSR